MNAQEYPGIPIHYRTRSIVIFSCILIVFASISIGIDVRQITMDLKSVEHGYGTWFALVWIITGVLGLISILKPALGLIVANMVMSIITAATCVPYFAFAIIWMQKYKQDIADCTEEMDQGGENSDCTSKELQDYQAVNSYTSVSLGICLFVCFVALSMAVFCGRTIKNRNEKAEMSAAHVDMMRMRSMNAAQWPVEQHGAPAYTAAPPTANYGTNDMPPPPAYDSLKF